MRCGVVLLFAVLLLYGCGRDLPAGAQRIILDEQLSSVGATTYQIYWKVQDTASWERTFAAADTIYREPGYQKLRSGGIWYEMSVDSTGLKAAQHYPGWERALDSVPVTSNIVYDGVWERMVANVPAADVGLDSDSVRIAIINVLGRAFEWQRFPLDHPDYLMLLPPGRDSMPISLSQDNIGPVTGSTVFRVGRHHYGLRSLSEDRREIVIERVTDPGDRAVSAQLDLNYRRVAALNKDGEPAYISREPDKELILFFTGLSPQNQRTLGRMDSVYQAMPEEQRARYQLCVIFQNVHLSSLLPEYVPSLSPNIGVYFGNEKTCLRLNCRPNYPYFAHIDERGKIRSFWNHPDKLTALFVTSPTPHPANSRK